MQLYWISDILRIIKIVEHEQDIKDNMTDYYYYDQIYKIVFIISTQQIYQIDSVSHYRCLTLCADSLFPGGAFGKIVLSTLIACTIPLA